MSVTTVEELLGLIAANPRAVIEFLPGIDLPQVQADGAVQARSPAAPGYGALPFLYVDRYGAEAWTTDV